MPHELPPLTRRQEAVYHYLLARESRNEQPPSLNELCLALNLASRGSLHKHISALIDHGLVKPMNRLHRGVRLTDAGRTGGEQPAEDTIPLLGYIAAGSPIEAISDARPISVPPALRSKGTNYLLEVRGDSMIDEGILDGDWVVIEQRDSARNGEIVVALVNGEEATLKRIEQKPGQTILHPANPDHAAQRYTPDQITIQGVLVGQMRRYQ